MNIGIIIYNIIIRPIELLFEVIFCVSNRVTNNIGVAIIVLSLLMNLLVLPLYHRADMIQKENEKKKSGIKKWEDHIKHSFSGDERFLMLQTYYRQNDYKPYQTLSNVLPLLLEIPFFIAAFKFLSELTILQGVSFGPIKDLARPDGIIELRDYSINLLPILMTLINIISSSIYSKGKSLVNKIQMYGIAIVFLLFLYNSPAGLCFYWTLNNVFSLFKNIIYKLHDIINKNTEVKSKNTKSTTFLYDSGVLQVFLSATLFMVCLAGLYIPTIIIGSSVEDFYNVSSQYPTNPLNYIINNSFIYVGVMVFWLGIIFYLSGKKFRILLSAIVTFLATISIIHFSLIKEDVRISKYLIFDSMPSYDISYQIQSYIIVFASLLLSIVIFMKRKKLIVYPLTLASIILIILSVNKIIDINSAFHQKKSMLETHSDLPELKMCKDGKNVVVIMMDRMMSYYIPYIFNERPELVQQFDGFTYYPNCVSLGTSTNSGSPGLYGGYEYTPEGMNKRDTVLLKDKQNEALKIMPILFDKNGFDVTVSDPTYANYNWIPDLSIYDDYPQIKKFISMGRMNYNDYSDLRDSIINRNFFFYSLYKVSPVFLKKYVYDSGEYYTPSTNMNVAYQSFSNKHIAYGISDDLYNSYCVLDRLSDITLVDKDSKNSFIMMSNDLTHSPGLLQEPDYVPAGYVNNTEYDNNNGIRADGMGNSVSIFMDESDNTIDLKNVVGYDVNMATLIQLGKWFDYLKKNELYDNTRIIIVSDHSTDMFFDDNYIYNITYPDGKKLKVDLYKFQSTLLVKDFDSTGFVMDYSFMTNADVPSIAMDGIINNPINPFTGNLINSDRKYEGNLQMQVTSSWSVDKNNSFKYSAEHYFTVKDDIFDSKNWSYLGYY